MADDVATTNTKPNPVVQFIRADRMQKMVQERLGRRAGQFTTSLISLVNTNENIAACTPMTVIQAALTAASMDLPINQNLGFAYIVPYKNHGVMEAQFQMGYKGFIQLAQRSGKFQTINTTDVREGEVKTRDRMTGELEFDWLPDDEREAAPVVGYLAYFELLNGFKKSLYMTKAEIEAHAGRYSQAYKARGKSNFRSPWETDFDLMAQKTALKLLLGKFAPLSTEMQEAVAADQAVDDGTGRKYIDNDDLADVKASDDKKAAIIAANTGNSGKTKSAAPEAETTDSGDEASESPAAPGEITDDMRAANESPGKPKKSVKEMVAERGWDGKGKQTGLVDDNDSSS